MPEPLTPASVTVAVATYGRPEALTRCLDALARSAVVPGEVIVVDQAPSREARALVTMSGLPGARYVEQAPLGLSASRNLALKLAAGAVLAVTDDDCAPDEDWVRALVAAFSREPLPVAVTGRILPLGPARRGAYAVSLRESVQGMDHAARVVPWRVGSGANFAARTDRLREQGGWDERLGAGSPGRAGEDLELLDRLLGATLSVRYDPDAVVRHEWQTRARRQATRWSYGFGIGALIGILTRRGDAFALRLLADYVRLHVRGLVSAGRRRDGFLVMGHARALAGVPPGLLYGVRADSLAAARAEQGST